MKTLLKLTFAITIAATFGAASLFADRPYRYVPPSEIAPLRLVAATPVAKVKCDTMTVHGGGRNGMVTVPCKHYAQVRPDDCRRACAN